MKTRKAVFLLLPVFGLALQAEQTWAQSTFLLRNYLGGSQRLDAPVFDAYGNRLGGTNYVAMLYAGLSKDSLSPVTEVYPRGQTCAPVPFTFVVNGASGYVRHTGILDNRVLAASVPVGQLAWLQLRAWDISVGASFEEAVSQGIGGYGESNFFQDYGDDVAFPSFTVGYLCGLESFSLLPIVPEPSAAWLLLLGLPWLIYRHCRKPPGKRVDPN